MAFFLILETATKICSVAIAKDEEIIALLEDKRGNTHASIITLAIQKVLDIAKLDIKQIDAVVLSAGPGSYTGLRVGSSTAKGLCFSLKIPLIAVNTLEALAYGIRIPEESKPQYSNYIIPMIDSRRDEVYLNVFDPNLNMLSPSQPMILTVSCLEQYRHVKAQWHVCGSGAPKSIDLLQFPNIILHSLECSAKYYVKLAFRKYLDQDFENIAYFRPNYLKAPNVTIPKKIF